MLAIGLSILLLLAFLHSCARTFNPFFFFSFFE
uniref:Uncharacterized protein n=1 Tax=Rhizophora mucronata TaxID=61149 RepID=A0A2P2N175_RHIMU